MIKKSLYPIILFLLCSFFYGITFRGSLEPITPNRITSDLITVGQPFESTLARGRYAQTMAIVEDGVYDLRDGKELVALPDLGHYGTKFYSLFAPGISLLAVPAYKIGQLIGMPQVTVFFALSLIGALNGVLIYFLAKAIGSSSWAAFFSGLIYTLGSTAWPYSVTLAQHNTSVMCLLVIILSAIWAKRHSWAYALGWGAYGFAIFVDYPNMLILFPAVLYMIYQSVHLKFGGASAKLRVNLGIVYGLLPFILLGLFHAQYNLLNFNSPSRIGTAALEHVKTADQINALKAGHEYSREVATSRVVSGMFHAKRLHSGFVVLFSSIGRGLLVFAPITLFGIYGLQLLSKKHLSLSIAIAGVCVMNILLYTSFGDPWGGWEFGPRYLLPAMAVSIPSIALLLTLVRSVLLRLSVFVVFMYSSAVNLIGVVTTNQLPAEVEASSVEVSHTISYNIQLLLEGVVGSNLGYTHLLSHYLTKLEYTILLYSTVGVVAIAVLFVWPYLVGRRSHG